MCRSRRELSNAYLLAKFGFDTAVNGPSKVWRYGVWTPHPPQGSTGAISTTQVEIVPFLKKPGFCTLRTPGLHKEAEKILDLSNSDGVVVRAAASKDGLKNFRVMISTEGAGRGMMNHVVYSAEFTATEEMADHFVSWHDFKCSHHGKDMDWFCPRLYHELDKVLRIFQ